MRTLLIVGILFLGGAVALPRNQEDATPIPDWVVSNWEHLIGTWVADNPGDGGEMDAYGVEWSWGLGRKSLVGRLYGIQDGREVATFWEFREFWHPGEAQLILTQYGRDGTYGAGPHERKDEGATEMLQTFFDPTRNAIVRVGHRSKLEGDVHTTASFDVTEDGVWKPRRTYVWHRQRD